MEKPGFKSKGIKAELVEEADEFIDEGKRYHSVAEFLSEALLQQLKTLSFRVTDSEPIGCLNVAEQTNLQVLRTVQDQVKAQEVAAITGRARAIGSVYLNVLHRRAVVLKERKGRRVIFTLKEEYLER